MRELVVDMTPTCINRTAIHHIASDTYAALERHFAVAPQYLGQRRQRAFGRAAEAAISTAFLEGVRHWATASVHVDEIGFHPRFDVDHAPRLYFDPIYALWRHLHEDDVVFVLDMSTLTNPEWHQANVAVAYERAFRKLLSSPAKVVCISDHCAAALRTSFAIPQGDIHVVPLYLRALPTHDTEPPKVQLEPSRFLLCVGSLETRKNLLGLLHAFALSGLAAQKWKLAIVGGNGHGHEAIIEAAADLPGVEILGFVTDATLAWLYANAAAFVYPSFLEGFGLPLLEAMAHGLPCLASITGASREVCADLAVLVDPYHVPSIVDGLIACTQGASPSDDGAGRILKDRARQFTFQRYLEALMPVFDRLSA